MSVELVVQLVQMWWLMEYQLLLMRMTAQSDVFGHVHSILPYMEVMQQTLVLRNALHIHMEIMILVFVYKLAFSILFSMVL